MTYEEAITALQNNHIYPKVVKVVKKKGEDIVSLEIDAPEIRVSSKMEILSKVLGKGWMIDRLPNKGIIEVRKKK